MTTTKHNPIIRLLPSLTDVAFLMPIVFLFAALNGVKTLLGDGDTGWHIRAGEWMLANGRVIRNDVFSYTKPGDTWYAWEWLWDVWFAWMHQQWGMEAVVLVSLLVLCFTSVILFRLTQRKCGNSFIAIGMTFTAIAASSVHWLARPHLISMLFVVLFLSVLDRVDTEGNKRLLGWLPVLTVVWTNLHGAFFLGIIFVGAYAAGELLQAAIERDRSRLPNILGRLLAYTVTAVACFAASFANPYTYELHLHIAQYLTESYHFDNINEFQTVSFHVTLAKYFEVLLLIGMAAALWNGTRRRFGPALLLLGTAHMALLSGRNIPIYAFVAAVLGSELLVSALIAARHLDVAAWVGKRVNAFLDLAAVFGSVDRAWRIHAVSLAVLALVSLLLYRGTSPAFKAEYDPERYPAAALAVMRSLEPSARILTDDEWGDYLIYHLYPATKVLIDGRSDFYGENLGNEVGSILKVHYDWEARVRRFGVDTVLLRANAALAGTMKESARWRVVHDDGVAIVFRVNPQVAVTHSSFAARVANGNRDREITDSVNHHCGVVTAPVQPVVVRSRDHIQSN